MKQFVKAVGGLKHSVIYTDTDGRHYRFYGGTWAWRNHNPGNIENSACSRRHNQIGVTHQFAIFPDDESGHQALLDSLRTTYWNKSIHDMIYAYAPPKDHNPTAYYEKLLRKELRNLSNPTIDGVVIASVVPKLQSCFKNICKSMKIKKVLITLC